ncbi:TCP-1/cpn60 chaperonin family protein [Vibrio phage 1.244.A._10N.261.54.C3]|nr:TCP-1/cpn60 chaperonin family protein [Vibrio phage 1.244.A._10N.261.54.C3]AUR98771.1 TCP-1/cpn60 chaperonin family protein [Vibrio phage 1.255.O._10N.286.45.F1]
MVKEIQYGTDARSAMMAGVDAVANAVKVTLGPKGRNVILEQEGRMPVITKDGVSVAREIVLEDPFENLGAQVVRDVASQANNCAGDGTTTATVIAQAIVQQSDRIMPENNVVTVKRGMDQATAHITKLLGDYAVPCQSEEQVANVGTISANGDTTVGGLIASAMSQVGRDGVITVEDGRGFEDELIVVEGMQFGRGYLSPYFVNGDNDDVKFNNALILVTDNAVSNINDLVPAMELAISMSRPLLIIADNVDGEALATLGINNLRGVVKVCAIKAPSFGEDRLGMLADLAILTGGELISNQRGLELKDVRHNPEWLGKAGSVTVTKTSTTIVDGAGDAEAVEERAEALRTEALGLSEHDAGKVQERIAKLSGGIAVIRAGGGSEVDMKEKKDRIEDALNATRAAVEEGVIVGGGTALLRLSHQLDAMHDETKDADVRLGIDIISNAARAPFKQILANAGVAYEGVAEAIDHQEFNFGLNVRTGEYGNLIDMGVIDPVKVTRSSLQYASSIAGLILTTEAMVTYKRG